MSEAKNFNFCRAGKIQMNAATECLKPNRIYIFLYNLNDSIFITALKTFLLIIMFILIENVFPYILL